MRGATSERWKEKPLAKVTSEQRPKRSRSVSHTKAFQAEEQEVPRPVTGRRQQSHCGHSLASREGEG